MAYQIDPTASVNSEIHRIADERFALALAELEGLADADPASIEEGVHEVRKRCKELRGLARLVRPSLGDEFDRFNDLVRRAAVELSSIRDTHAVLDTVDELADGSSDYRPMADVRAGQAEAAREATRAIQGGDPRIRRAHKLLTKAQRRVRRWEVPDGFGPLGEGLGHTYRRGRRALRQAKRGPTDELMHEWRKAEKNLLYQMRLLSATAPSVMDPMIRQLDDLSEVLGGDHDLAVLIERLRADPKPFGGKKAVKQVVRASRDQQRNLRVRSLRIGATVYAESTPAFVARMEAYWVTTVELGPEPS